jgi:hypothetical protein
VGATRLRDRAQFADGHAQAAQAREGKARPATGKETNPLLNFMCVCGCPNERDDVQ